MRRFAIFVLLVFQVPHISAGNLIEIAIPDFPETQAIEQQISFHPIQKEHLLGPPPPPVTFVCGAVVPVQELVPVATLSNAKLVYYHSEFIFGRNPWIQVHTLTLPK